MVVIFLDQILLAFPEALLQALGDCVAFGLRSVVECRVEEIAAFYLGLPICPRAAMNCLDDPSPNREIWRVVHKTVGVSNAAEFGLGEFIRIAFQEL